MSVRPPSPARQAAPRVIRALAAAALIAGCVTPGQAPTGGGPGRGGKGEKPVGTAASPGEASATPAPAATATGPATAPVGVAAPALPVVAATTAPASAPAAALAGVVRVPARLLSDQGSGLISDQGSGLVSDQGTGLITDNGAGLITRTKYALRAVEAERPYAGATVRLEDAKGQALAEAKTDAEGRYRFEGDLPRQNLVLRVELPGGAGAVSAVAARKSAEVRAVDVDLVSTLATTYILDRYVRSQPADAQATLDKLPADVEAETRARAGATFAASGPVALATLTPVLLIDAVEALRKADAALDAQLEVVKRLLVVGAISASVTDGPALAAQLFQPTDVLLTPTGELVVADWLNHLIRVVTPDGRIGTLAGTGERGLADGPAATATFTDATRLGIDGAGTLYVADGHMRTIAPDGTVKTLPYKAPGPFVVAPAGMVVLVGGPDGKALLRVKPGGAPEPFAAGFTRVKDMALAPDGSVWVADDLYEGGLKRVAPDGTVEVMPTSARVGFPDHLTFGPDGTLYVLHDATYLVKRAPDGTTTPILTYRNGPDDGSKPGPAFYFAGGIVADPKGSLYLADNGNNRIRKIAPDGTVTDVAGNGQRRAHDGEGQQVLFNEPVSVAADPAGNVFIADAGSNRVRKLAPDGQVTTYAGSGAYGRADGPAAEATFARPQGLALAPDGTLYVTQTTMVRKVTPDGRVEKVFGGTGRVIDGKPNANVFNMLFGLCVGPAGDLFVTEKANYGPVWRVTPAGVTTTFLKNGTMDDTSDVVATADGTLYVAMRYRNKILRVTPQGAATPFVGAGQAGGADGTGAAATFSSPAGLGLGADGTLYVADVGNDAIRKVTPEGVVTTLPITGLEGPEDVAVLSDGRLVVADTGHNQVKIAPRP